MAEEKDKKAVESAAAEVSSSAETPAGETSSDAPESATGASAEKPNAAAKKDDAKKSSKKRAPAKKTAAKPKPAAAPAEPTFVRATARYVRLAPRKARLVVDHIRGESVDEARVFLQFTPRHAGRDVAKVLESAVANAEHNHELDGGDLHVVKAYVDEGPTLKRWRPRAKGRATQILKRTSHITVVVSDVPAKELNKNRKAAA
jgi:ribosomal protein L22